MDAYFLPSTSFGAAVSPFFRTGFHWFFQRGPSHDKNVTHFPGSDRLLRSLTIPVLALLATAASPGMAMEQSSMTGQARHEAVTPQKKHLVQPGETLSWIAGMYGVSTALLAHHNGLVDPGSIKVNQLIYIPGGGQAQEAITVHAASSPPPLSAHPETNNALQDKNLYQPGPSAPNDFDAPQGGKPAPSTGGFDARPYAYFGNSEPTADVLRHFASNYSIPLVISDKVSGVVSGKIGPLEPVDFLDKIAQLNGLIWYFDGNGLYVYASQEIEKQIVNLRYIDTEEFVSTLKDIGIWDNRFYWRSRPEEGIIYLSGPPRYMELVTETAQLLDAKSGERKKSRQTVRVFPLRYAWADDRSFSFRNQEVAMPGVASVLRQIVQGGATLEGIGSAQTRSLPGIQGASPAGQSPSPKTRQDPQPPASSEGAFINADRRLNAVIVRDLESRMAMYEDLIETLDKPLSQVEINVSIIDVNTNNLSQLGVNWRFDRSSGTSARFNGFGSSADITGGGPLSTVINLTSGDLLTQINLMSERGNAKILARPSVMTLDNMQAVLDNSQTFYVRVAGQEAAELFPVTYGSVLKVTPRIVNEPQGRKLHLSVNVQDGGQATEATGADNIPVVRNSSISTQAVIEEHESLLVGGYYYEETRNTQRGVPLLEDVPIVGAAFRNTVKQKTKNVRLFLITPRILNLM